LAVAAEEWQERFEVETPVHHQEFCKSLWQAIGTE
jgi:hypothetical protein